MRREITDEMLDRLSEKVKPYLTDARYSHTRSTVKEAERLGRIYLSDEVNRLKAAAWLHDITKKDDFEKQLQYVEKSGIIIDSSTSPKVLHSLTAPYVAKRDFEDFVDDEILGGIRWHTTGHSGMTVFECIIYLADFIEETRTFDDCAELRRFFYDKIENEEKESVLIKTMIYSFDLTIKGLIEEGFQIDADTVRARNFFIGKKEFRTDKK